MIDDCLEAHIADALHQVEQCYALGLPVMARSWFEAAKVLISDRSPEQQRLMELAKGLAVQ